MIASFIIFLTIVLSVYLGMHYYVYSRVTQGLMLSAVAASRLGIFFIFAALSFFLGEVIAYDLKPEEAYARSDRKNS